MVESGTVDIAYPIAVLDLSVTSPSGQLVVTALEIDRSSSVAVVHTAVDIIELGVQGPEGIPGGGEVAPLATRLDDVGGGVTYVGEANPGTVNSDSTWRIKKIVETGPDIVISWADGDSDYDNVWDDRLTLTYI